MPIKEIDTGIEAGRIQLMSWPGNIYMKNDDNFYYIPSVFQDNIYEYEKQGSWERTIHKGLNNQSPITVIDENNDRQPDSEISLANRNEPLRFLLHNRSRGFLKPDEYLFHFTFTDRNNKRFYGVEIYDQNLEPIGYSPIKSIPITDGAHNHIQWLAQDVDNEGNFYFMERYSEGSRIRVLQVSDKDLEQLPN